MHETFHRLERGMLQGEDIVEDRLLELERAIEALAKDRALALFKADDLSWLWSYDDSGRRETTTDVIDWREAKGWEAFVGIGAAMGTNVLYVDARRFSWEELVDRIDSLSVPDADEIARRKTQAAAFRKYDGLIEHLIIAFRANGIWHTYQDTADWLLKYEELEAEPDELEEEEEALSEDMLESLAGKLARDPAFPRVKNKGDQIAMAKKLFAKEGDVVLDNVGEVVSRARIIYQTKVLPDNEPKRRR